MSLAYLDSQYPSNLIPTINVYDHEVPLNTYWSIVDMFNRGISKSVIVDEIEVSKYAYAAKDNDGEQHERNRQLVEEVVTHVIDDLLRIRDSENTASSPHEVGRGPLIARKANKLSQLVGEKFLGRGRNKSGRKAG